MKKTLLSLALFTIFWISFSYWLSVATLDWVMSQDTTTLNSSTVANYRQICLTQPGNNDNIEKAIYVNTTINPNFYYTYYNTNPVRVRAVLNSTNMLIYNPWTFNSNGQFTFLSNLNPNRNSPNNDTVAVTALQNTVQAVANSVWRTNVAWMYVLFWKYNTYTAWWNNGSNTYGYRDTYTQPNATILHKNLSDPGAYQELYSCVRYFVAKCWDWVKDYPWVQINWLPVLWNPNEQCDGTDWVPAWYTCNAQCILVQNPQMADLSVTKVVNNPTPTVWSNVTFTMVLSNAWPANAWWVTLTDILPSWYTYVSSTASQWTYNSTNWIWNVWTINVGTTKTLTITATVKATWPYVNTIEVTTSDKADPDSTPNNHIPTEDDQASATVTPSLPAPTCVLTVNPSSILSWWTAGISRLINWSFVIPTYIYVSPAIQWAWPHLVNTATWTAYALPSHTGTYTFTMTVMNINWLQNTCTATLNVWTPPPQMADLSVTKVVNNPTPTVWSNVTFTMVLSNAWPANAGWVTLTDILPSWYTYVSSTTSQWTYNPTNWIWNVWTINVGTTKTLTITATVKATWPYVNTIEVTTSDKVDPDSTPNNHIPTEDDQASATVIPPTQNPILTIQKTVISNIVYHSWDQVWFKITFQNIWSWTANQVVLTDILPSSLTYVSSTIFWVTANLNVNTFGANAVITYSGFNLAPWAGWYMVITWILNTNNAYNNRTNYTDIIASNHPLVSATAQFMVLDIPNNVVIMTKTWNKSDFTPWESIQFTIAVTNQWPNPINDLTITDVRPNPSCITYTSWSSPDWFTNNASMSRYRPWVLNVWWTVTLTLNWTISSNASCAWSYNNVANLTYYVFGDLKTKTANFPFDVLVWGQCQSLTPLNGTVILIENWEADAQFRCDASAPSNIRIECWNGQNLNWFGSSYTATCNYNNPGTYNVKCYVENTTNNNCAQTIIVDEWMLWYCGNGTREWYEDCDLWWTSTQRDNGIAIHDYLDLHWLDAGRYANDWYSCENCAIKKQWYYEAPACNWISTTLSVQKWEILPFRWDLEWSNIVDEDDCEDADNWDILKDSLICTFKVFNWNNNQQYDDDYTYKTEKYCDVDERNWNVIFDYFEDHKYDIFHSLEHPFGKYYFTVNNFLASNTYGEYKLTLDKVEYKYCDWSDEEQWTEIDRICEVNFAVTKPYLMQKSLFGVTPKATTDINLDQFYDMKNEKLINKTDLSSIMKVDADDYAGWAKMDKQISDFVNKYTKLSTKLLSADLNRIAQWWTITQARKVPWKQIYIIEWNGTMTFTNKLSAFTKPFTMIIKWMNVIVEGALTTNWMFVVQWWKISFREDPANRCVATQTVQWIFISDKWFGVWDVTLNMANDLDKPRCNFGWLDVKWVLIWKNIQDLVVQRRSQLNDRFWVHSSDDEQIKIERRNKIFKWASVLIEYSPSLRWALPPWASDFTKILEVYKK